MRSFRPLLRSAAPTVFPFRFRQTHWIIRRAVEIRLGRQTGANQLLKLILHHLGGVARIWL